MNVNIGMFQYFQLSLSKLDLPNQLNYSQVFFVTLPHIDAGSFMVPLMACADHIRIYSADFLRVVLTLCFHEIRYMRMNNYFLKIRMLDGNVYYVDFGYKFLLKRFLTQSIEKGFIKAGFCRLLFKHGRYYPRKSSRFYV